MSPKNIVLFGATGGIGSMMAPIFYASGASLTLSGRDTIKLKKVADPFEPRRVRIITADATKPDDVDKVLQAASAFGPVDAVVISAGSHEPVDLDTSTEETARIFERHKKEFLDITFWVGRQAARLFRAQNRGHLVYLSSHVTADNEKKENLKGNLTYRMTKVGAERYLKDLRKELKGTSARITVIAPSTVNTPGNAEKYLQTAERRAGAVQPEAIAHEILKCISDPASPEWILMEGSSDFENR
jgi:NADP-dependent 3-hydroxy acid dehydrogenase YdfG